MQIQCKGPAPAPKSMFSALMYAYCQKGNHPHFFEKRGDEVIIQPFKTKLDLFKNAKPSPMVISGKSDGKKNAQQGKQLQGTDAKRSSSREAQGEHSSPKTLKPRDGEWKVVNENRRAKPRIIHEKNQKKMPKQEKRTNSPIQSQVSLKKPKSSSGDPGPTRVIQQNGANMVWRAKQANNQLPAPNSTAAEVDHGKVVRPRRKSPIPAAQEKQS